MYYPTVKNVKENHHDTKTFKAPEEPIGYKEYLEILKKPIPKKFEKHKSLEIGDTVTINPNIVVSTNWWEGDPYRREIATRAHEYRPAEIIQKSSMKGQVYGQSHVLFVIEWPDGLQTEVPAPGLMREDFFHSTQNFEAQEEPLNYKEYLEILKKPVPISPKLEDFGLKLVQCRLNDEPPFNYDYWIQYGNGGPYYRISPMLDSINKIKYWWSRHWKIVLNTQNTTGFTYGEHEPLRNLKAPDTKPKSIPLILAAMITASVITYQILYPKSYLRKLLK